MMGRKVLLAAACWLTLHTTWADAKRTETKLEDSAVEASVQRLYRNLPVGVYASASPYAAFSFQVPTFASSPKIAQLGPVKQESVIVENTHGFLKDSYGNKFVESPQAFPYRSAFPQQYVQLQELPAHLAQPLVSAAPSFQYKQVTPHFFGPSQFKVQALQAASPSSANRYAFNQPHSFSGSIRTLAPNQQQQNPSSNQAIYADPHIAEQFQNLKNVGKFQRLAEIPRHQENQGDKAQLKADASTAHGSKGTKPVANLVTKPLVPLLDLSLLEPLTFANPLVPQVQHFLPRINSVKYHKLPQLDVHEVKTKMKQFVIQNTKSYDSGLVKAEPKEKSPKKTETKSESEHEEAHGEPSPPSEDGPPRDISAEEPEIVYEINSPNYKETYKEKVLSYNKETQSEPVHYNYEKKTDSKPVHYNYVRTSKEPLQVKSVSYESDGQNPKQLIYHFKPEENNQYQKDEHNPSGKESQESSDEPSEDEPPSHQGEQNEAEADQKDSLHRESPKKKEVEHLNQPEIQHNIHHNSPQDYSQVKNIPVEHINDQFQPIITEYEEDIRILPTPKQHATIKVDPNQHIQHGQVDFNHKPQESPIRPHNLPLNPPTTQHHQRAHYQPEHRAHENAEKENSPDEGNPNDEPSHEETPEHDEKSEEDFEKGYKDAAYGFPAYETSSRDAEKAIYDPNTYGQPQYHTDFDIEHSPFQQYQVEGDDFPKSTRSNYKDARDKTKEDYYLDYAVSKPESLVARYKQKEDYYNVFNKRKPEYLNNERETEQQNQKQSAKYVAAPAFLYRNSPQKPKQQFAKYKAAPYPQALEYDYSKEEPKDSSARATRPIQRLKTHTQFVEPQFQYGFEPSALPRLLDSELAAMASNNKPESENPGKRKKIYKENWYIKKTTTNDRKADS